MRLIALSLILASAMLDCASAQSQSGDSIVFVNPTRRPLDAPPAAPADLPTGADVVDPLTFEMVTTRKPRKGGSTVQRQTVSRTKDRIHIVTVGKEWLFERNPVDPRRVSAYLIHHPAKTVVLHEESDLRNTLGINGWGDVLTIGSAPASASPLTPSGFTVRHESGVTTVAIRQLRAGANPQLLQSPSSRFPDYKMLDLAEWLEGAPGTRRR